MSVPPARICSCLHEPLEWVSAWGSPHASQPHGAETVHPPTLHAPPNSACTPQQWMYPPSLFLVVSSRVAQASSDSQCLLPHSSPLEPAGPAVSPPVQNQLHPQYRPSFTAGTKPALSHKAPALLAHTCVHICWGISPLKAIQHQ